MTAIGVIRAPPCHAQIAARDVSRPRRPGSADDALGARCLSTSTFAPGRRRGSLPPSREGSRLGDIAVCAEPWVVRRPPAASGCPRSDVLGVRRRMGLCNAAPRGGRPNRTHGGVARAHAGEPPRRAAGRDRPPRTLLGRIWPSQSRRSDRPSTGLTTSTSIAAGCDIAPCHGPRDSGAARTDSTECLDRPDRSRRAALRTPAELPLGAHWRTTRSVRARKSARDIPRCGLAKEAARAVSRPKRSGELQGAFNPSGALPTANRPEHRALPDRTGLKSHLRTLRNACRAITSSTLSFAPSWLGLPRPITSSP